MKQKIKDYFVMLQNDRKTQLVTGAALVVLVAFMLNSPPERAPLKKKPTSVQLGTGGTGTAEAYQDIIQAFSQDVKVLQDQVKGLQTDSKDREKAFSDYDAKTAAIFTKILERMNSGEIGTSNGGFGSLAPVNIDGSSSGSGSSALAPTSTELEPFGLDQGDPIPPPAPPRPKSAFVAVGDSVRVTLLAGVNAPTDGTPYPVVFKLSDDVLGPDGSRLPLGEARLIAAAQGSLTDSRALFRMTDLSIRLADGQRRTYKVDGWIVGEDGVRGMKGRLIDYLGKALGAATAIGAAEGAADAVSASKNTSFLSNDGNLTQVATGNTGSLVAASALAGGLGKWGDIIKERIDQLVPHVEVLSGREATAVFAKSVVIDGLFEAMEDDGSAFASLD
ncbi:MAG: TrbI/VirB10 family protein [bacterium]|nr:TrbI/VirB10 family protein [bacterium]